jgi:hypothetical protein
MTPGIILSIYLPCITVFGGVGNNFIACFIHEQFGNCCSKNAIRISAQCAVLGRRLSVKLIRWDYRLWIECCIIRSAWPPLLSVGIDS